MSLLPGAPAAMPISRNQQNKKKSNRTPLTKNGDKLAEEKVEARIDAARKLRAQEHKTRGNEAFSAGNWLAAIAAFTDAIQELLPAWSHGAVVRRDRQTGSLPEGWPQRPSDESGPTQGS